MLKTPVSIITLSERTILLYSGESIEVAFIIVLGVKHN